MYVTRVYGESIWYTNMNSNTNEIQLKLFHFQRFEQRVLKEEGTI